MKVLTDWHHGGLYYSLHCLFEKRLGWELYRPIGLDWMSQGWWRVAEPYGYPKQTIQQYLGTAKTGYVPYKYLNGDHEIKDGVYYVHDAENDFTHKAITYEKFKEMKFDYIVATHPLHEHWDGLLKFQPKATFLVQLGNKDQRTKAKTVLSSVWSFKPDENQRVVYYHQEGDMSPFTYTTPLQNRKITSFVHLLPEPELYDLYRGLLPEFEFKAYGSSARDGVPIYHMEMGDKMRESTFGWHVKPLDGYGHLLHQWFCCGRPVITRGNYYLGQTGGLLLEDNITCIDLDKGNQEENVKRIRYWAKPENHRLMCERVHEKFLEVVDYNKEAECIKTFLSNTS